MKFKPRSHHVRIEVVRRTLSMASIAVAGGDTCPTRGRNHCAQLKHSTAKAEQAPAVPALRCANGRRFVRWRILPSEHILSPRNSIFRVGSAGGGLVFTCFPAPHAQFSHDNTCSTFAERCGRSNATVLCLWPASIRHKPNTNNNTMT